MKKSKEKIEESKKQKVKKKLKPVLHARISDKILRSFACVDEMLTVVIFKFFCFFNSCCWFDSSTAS